tara:strand:+ start:224 stop:667 length:444 start_codon:yes stop_codon:yes gene_type:complete
MNHYDKIKLYIITIILDFFLLNILLINKSSFFDKIWITSVIISHILFYYSLTYDIKIIIDILHIFVFILPTLSFFCSNIFLKIISIFLFTIIQLLWVYEKRCILNEENEDWGYGDYLNSHVIIFSVILSINIGYNLQFIPENQYITI